jgi:hypothetical protein
VTPKTIADWAMRQINAMPGGIGTPKGALYEQILKAAEELETM